MGGIELLILVFTGLTIHSFFMAKCKLEKTFLPGENTAEPKTKQRASEIYQLFPTRFLVPKSFMMFPHVFVPHPKNPSFWICSQLYYWQRKGKYVGKIPAISTNLTADEGAVTIALVMIVENWVCR